MENINYNKIPLIGEYSSYGIPRRKPILPWLVYVFQERKEIINVRIKSFIRIIRYGAGFIFALFY